MPNFALLPKLANFAFFPKPENVPNFAAFPNFATFPNFETLLNFETFAKRPNFFSLVYLNFPYLPYFPYLASVPLPGYCFLVTVHQVWLSENVFWPRLRFSLRERGRFPGLARPERSHEAVTANRNCRPSGRRD